MIFKGLIPWQDGQPTSIIEAMDKNRILDLHADWLLESVHINYYNQTCSTSLNFSSLRTETNERFILKFQNTEQFSITPEFGAKGGAYKEVDEFRYWQLENVNYIEFFGAMSQMRFTFETVELVL